MSRGWLERGVEKRAMSRAGRTLDYVLETGETNDVRASFEDGKDSRDSGACGGQAVDGRL